MAEPQDEVVIVDAKGEEHVFPAGFDPARAAAIVKQQTGTVSPVPADAPSTYRGGYMQGAVEGMTQGAEGIAHLTKGVIPGAKDALKALYGSVRHPIDTAVGMAKGAVETASNAPDAIVAAAKRFAAAPQSPGGIDALLALLPEDVQRLAATDPTAFGEQVGKLTGVAEVGVLVGRGVPLATRPAARTLGQGVAATAKALRFPARLAGSAATIGGNPLGLAGIVAPDVAEAGGTALKNWGAREPAFMEKEIQQFRGPRETPAPPSSIRVSPAKPDLVDQMLEEARTKRQGPGAQSGEPFIRQAMKQGLSREKAEQLIQGEATKGAPATATTPAPQPSAPLAALQRRLAEEDVEARAAIRGTGADVPDNPEAKAVEAARRSAATDTTSKADPVKLSTADRATHMEVSRDHPDWSLDQVDEEVAKQRAARHGVKYANAQQDAFDRNKE